MAIIVLTGGIGSGKSEATRQFSALGVPIVDTDVIAHTLTAPNGAAITPIIESFGKAFIEQNGALDRQKMREHIFTNPQSKTILEAIMHPRIYQVALTEIKQNSAILAERNSNIHYQIIAVPLLFEGYQGDEPSQYAKLADYKLVIDCETDTQIKRTMARSNIDIATVKAIMATQVSREKRITMADIVIENNTTLQALTDKINKYHHQFNEKCDKLAHASFKQ